MGPRGGLYTSTPTWVSQSTCGHAWVCLSGETTSRAKTELVFPRRAYFFF